MSGRSSSEALSSEALISQSTGLGRIVLWLMDSDVLAELKGAGLGSKALDSEALAKEALARRPLVRICP